MAPGESADADWKSDSNLLWKLGVGIRMGWKGEGVYRPFGSSFRRLRQILCFGGVTGPLSGPCWG